MKKRKIAYICSPLRGAAESNIIRANLYARFAYEKGFLPLAPHAIFTQFLDDENAMERAAGMNLGLQLLEQADEIWVFGLIITQGMKREIERARALKLKVRSFSSEMEEL